MVRGTRLFLHMSWILCPVYGEGAQRCFGHGGVSGTEMATIWTGGPHALRYFSGSHVGEKRCSNIGLVTHSCFCCSIMVVSRNDGKRYNGGLAVVALQQVAGHQDAKNPFVASPNI